MAEWKQVKIGEIAKHRKGSIIIKDDTEYKLCRVQLHRKGIVLREMRWGCEIKTKKQQVCKTGDMVVAEMDAKFGGYGFINRDFRGRCLKCLIILPTDEGSGFINEKKYFFSKLNYYDILE